MTDEKDIIEPEKNESVYVVWCEWDIGQVGKIFLSRSDAMEWLTDAWMPKELGELQESFEIGLVKIDELEVIRPAKKND
jgi:hypothetical protein